MRMILFVAAGVALRQLPERPVEQPKVILFVAAGVALRQVWSLVFSVSPALILFVAAGVALRPIL